MCLTLETQAEVDAVFAVFNHSPICDALGFGNAYECLIPFKAEPNSHELHLKLNKLLK